MHEAVLQENAQGQLVIVSRPGHKCLQVEIVCSSRKTARVLVKEFGGRIEKLPRNWLEQFALDNSKPINIGKRRVILRSGSFPVPESALGEALLLIPASVAFGTGEHATTAMSLRLLEQLTRRWKAGWSLADLGTGSGILALAAKRFGAGPVVGIDNDPITVSTAKSNARLNKVRGVIFQLADVRKWKAAQETDVITANLYSDLLIEILPRLNKSGWLILSGILHRQKNEFLRALRRNQIDAVTVKHRGKWMAVLAKHRSGVAQISKSVARPQ